MSLRADCPVSFQRGDSNRDNKLNLTDPITTLGYLFLGMGEPGCIDAADADDNGRIDLSDAVFTVGYLFLGGAPIPPPNFGECDFDPTDDLLGCVEFPPCFDPNVRRCADNGCCDAGSYCEKGIDDCDGFGACMPRPEACPDIFDPWCGCDGVTYSSRCQAAGAGVNVVHQGPCGKPGGCATNDDCELDAYCSKPEGLCRDGGDCALRPVECQVVFDPVCGCDGTTYDSDCQAAEKGASIAYRGRCQPGERCQTNDDCDAKEYCLRAEKLCDDPGICVPRPVGCAYFFDPVCACDGATYDNVCFASANGVTLSHFGPCEDVQPCNANEECDVGSFCARREGICLDPGYCHKNISPQDCVGLPNDQVCGCDDITYPNDCEALALGIPIQRRGSCDVGGRCKSNDDCVEAAYCNKDPGFCGDAGFCWFDPKPEDCAGGEGSTVCGCDDKTYRSGCEANLAGVSIAYFGRCDGIPRCSSNADCSEESYCAFEGGACGGLGKCLPRPIECPGDLIDPVCGCDKRTYRNECFAAMAGVSVAFRGSCNGGGGECTTSALCGGGLYCAKVVGDCDGLGHCDAVPRECPDDVDPVCGCDGITYDNECKASAAGVNVLARGACPN
jgi:hypothetical protein